MSEFSSPGYGNMKITWHALEVSVFKMLKVGATRKKKVAKQYLYNIEKQLPNIDIFRGKNVIQIQNRGI